MAVCLLLIYLFHREAAKNIHIGDNINEIIVLFMCLWNECIDKLKFTVVKYCNGRNLQFNYAARFWAAIHRRQLDCSSILGALAVLHVVPAPVIDYYREIVSVDLDDYYAADELDAAVEQLLLRRYGKSKWIVFFS